MNALLAPIYLVILCAIFYIVLRSLQRRQNK